MRPLLIYLFLFLFNSVVFAEGYQLENSNQSSQVDIYLFSQELSQLNFFPMDITHKGSIVKNSIDQIFFDQSNHDNYAVLKFDLRYLGSSGVFKISETDYTCHGTFVNNRPYTLFTSGIQKYTVDKICQRLDLAKNNAQKNYFSKFYIIQSLLMNTAEAQSSCSNSNNQIKNIRSIQNVSSAFNSQAAIQKIGSCLADILRGAGNAVTGVIDGIKSLFTTSPSELWESLKKTAKGIKNFVVNIKDEMIKLKNSFMALDNDLLLSIGCQLAGEIITSAGIAVITGAGTAMLSLRISKVISRMSKLNHLFGRLNKLARFGNKKLAAKVLSCGIK